MGDSGQPSGALAADRRKTRLLEAATRRDQALMTTTSTLRRQWLSLTRNFSSYYFVQPPLWRVMLRGMWNQDRVAPDFASLGAVRSGTSLLSDYILQHPCVVLPLAKEVGVFQAPLARLMMAQFPTRRQMERTRKQFGKAITGYCAPIVPLLNFPYFAKAIAPNGKVIVIMRDPVERTFAHWRWEQARRRRVENDPLWKYFPSFDEIVRLEIEAFQTGGVTSFALSGVGGGLVRESIYLPFLKQLLEVYAPSGMHYINAADFFADPVAIAKQIYAFLELPPYDPVEMPVRNAAPPGEMKPETRKVLSDFFAPYNRELYSFLGRDYGWS